MNVGLTIQMSKAFQQSFIISQEEKKKENLNSTNADTISPKPINHNI